MEEHLKLLGDEYDSDSNLTNSSDSDCSVEISSTIDETEHELARLSTYLNIESDNEGEDDANYQWPHPPSLLESSSSENEELSDAHRTVSASESYSNSINQTNSKKRKRRQWSVKEKLDIVFSYEENKSKRKTAREGGCSPVQLRTWLKNKENLLNIYLDKKGSKRKRLNGGGKKLVFADLDHLLICWYRSKRTDPKDKSIAPGDVQRERITLRRLEKEGRRICKDLNKTAPASTWYVRFLKRHGLSLQRPKRQQKVPLDEVYRLATSFYTYIRRASQHSISRGPMGAFTVRDVANMDESPLALFGDQCKRSINDIGTPNETNGHISNKRFCTVLLTVFGKDQRMNPVVLFKGQGRVGVGEKQQYAKDICVIFTPKAVINGPTMESYVHDDYPKLLIADSAGSHLKQPIIQMLRRKKVVVAIVPKGCTQYLQVLDTEVFSVFKNHYQAAADEFLDQQQSRQRLKLSAKHQRILCTRLVSTPWARTMKSVDFERAFMNIGYTWVDESPISPRTLPGFVFDPTTIDFSTNNHDKKGEDVVLIDTNECQMLDLNNNRMKQLTMDSFMKK